jgi:hypothetical protein
MELNEKFPWACLHNVHRERERERERDKKKSFKQGHLSSKVILSSTRLDEGPRVGFGARNVLAPHPPVVAKGTVELLHHGIRFPGEATSPKLAHSNGMEKKKM